MKVLNFKIFGFKRFKVILTGLNEYNQIEESKLKHLMEESGLVFIKLVDILDQHFNRALNQIEMPIKVNYSNHLTFLKKI